MTHVHPIESGINNIFNTEMNQNGCNLSNSFLSYLYSINEFYNITLIIMDVI